MEPYQTFPVANDRAYTKINQQPVTIVAYDERKGAWRCRMETGEEKHFYSHELMPQPPTLHITVTLTPAELHAVLSAVTERLTQPIAHDRSEALRSVLERFLPILERAEAADVEWKKQTESEYQSVTQAIRATKEAVAAVPVAQPFVPDMTLELQPTVELSPSQKDAITHETERVYGTRSPQDLAKRILDAPDARDIGLLLQHYRGPRGGFVPGLLKTLAIPDHTAQAAINDPGWNSIAKTIATHLGKKPTDPDAFRKRQQLKARALASLDQNARAAARSQAKGIEATPAAPENEAGV